uniref:Uncharacterized protein n=1 Tax=Panagrolaimus davidi TaxID=227884 RepID=A0A914Q735_9BILA
MSTQSLKLKKTYMLVPHSRRLSGGPVCGDNDLFLDWTRKHALGFRVVDPNILAAFFWQCFNSDNCAQTVSKKSHRMDAKISSLLFSELR